MGIADQISQLLKNQLIIRHRTDREQAGKAARCEICSRRIVLPPGSLCLAIQKEGLVCSVCGQKYAPDMLQVLRAQQPETQEEGTATPFGNGTPLSRAPLSPGEWVTIAQEINRLSEISDELARGISRGIVEAPAGHIGLMHYAKDIQKPPRKETESEKDYELRVRTYRMTRLNEKISAETTGRIQKIRLLLQRLGLPSVSP